MLQIGSLSIANGLVMAPMAGYTHLAFRLLIRRMGAGMVMTEMVSAMGLVMGQKKSLGYLANHADEKPLGVQIFGSDPDVMARAGAMAAESGADLVDINMGCPVKKVIKTGSGAALLRDLRQVEAVVSAVRRACPLPLTVKIRIGWSPKNIQAVEIVKVIEDCGADAVTVHPRLASQGFSVPAAWEWIARARERARIPVIGNGDVFEPSHALEMKRRTGCNGVMIARGALRNPWLFEQIASLEKGDPVRQPTLAERSALILEHFRLLSQSLGEQKASLALRGVLLSYTKGLPHSGRFRENLTRIKDSKTLSQTLKGYFSTLQETGSV